MDSYWTNVVVLHDVDLLAINADRAIATHQICSVKHHVKRLAIKTILDDLQILAIRGTIKLIYPWVQQCAIRMFHAYREFHRHNHMGANPHLLSMHLSFFLPPSVFCPSGGRSHPAEAVASFACSMLLHGLISVSI